MTNTCADCKAAVAIAGHPDKYQCRAEPPQRVIVRVEDGGSAYWPIVSGTDWCYSFKTETLADVLAGLL